MLVIIFAIIFHNYCNNFYRWFHDFGAQNWWHKCASTALIVGRPETGSCMGTQQKNNPPSRIGSCIATMITYFYNMKGILNPCDSALFHLLSFYCILAYY
jgi:hypothetical protein